MGVHASGDAGLAGEVGTTDGDGGPTVGGAGVGLGVSVGTDLGAASRRSAAESGEFLVGAAAASTERIPNQAMPTVTTVATAQAIK